MKEIKPAVLYRIVEASEEKFKTFCVAEREQSAYASGMAFFILELKNELLEYSYDDHISSNYNEDEMEDEAAEDH